MAKQRAKKNVKKSCENLESESNFTNAEEQEIEKQIYEFKDLEVESRIGAIKAIRGAEIEHMLTELRLLRLFNKEHLQVPAMHFVKEKLANVSMKINEEDGKVEVEWKRKDSQESLLQQIARACDGMPSVSGFDFSSKAGCTTAAEFQIPDFGLQNTFHTPGASSQRLSVGTTPKTLRLPKPGEILLSVRGSPLGMYKDGDNMEAIHESEEG